MVKQINAQISPGGLAGLCAFANLPNRPVGNMAFTLDQKMEAGIYAAVV